MTHKCIICKSHNIEEFDAKFAPFVSERMFDNKDDETSLIHCKDCEFYYSSKRPSDDQMAEYYNGYRDEHYQKRREFFEPFYTAEFNKALGFSLEGKVARNECMIKILKKHIDFEHIENILDYGGDAGQYIPDEFTNANKFVYDVSGVQPVKGVSKIERDELKNKKWDLIMCNHVIEHLPNPMSVINEILSIMPFGGFLYIEVPYENFPEQNIKNNETVYIHEHINYFKKQTVRKIFELPNIEILENEYFYFYDDKSNIIGTSICCLIRKIQDFDIAQLTTKYINLKEQFDELKKQNEEQLKLLNNINNILERIKNFPKKVFSVVNQDKRKIITVFGIKIKIKRKRGKND